MDEGSGLALAELMLVVAVVLGIAVRELLVLRRDRARPACQAKRPALARGPAEAGSAGTAAAPKAAGAAQRPSNSAVER